MLGYLNNTTVVNKIKFNETSSVVSFLKIKDLIWVNSIYSNLNNIVYFKILNNTKTKKYINYFYWRLFFFKIKKK